MSETVFLAGATGAIGLPLAALLVEAGFRVVGTTRRRERVAELEALGVEPVLLDAFDESAVRAAVAAAAPGIVIHQLTDLPAGMKTDDIPAALARNARLREIATPHLAAAARIAGVRRMIAQSICFAYAPGQTPFREDAPLAASAHGVAALEHAVMAGPFEGLVLRYGRLYGPGTGVPAPAGHPALHVAVAAHVALDAVTRGTPGLYNVAEDDGEVDVSRARAAFGWPDGFTPPTA